MIKNNDSYNLPEDQIKEKESESQLISFLLAWEILMIILLKD